MGLRRNQVPQTAPGGAENLPNGRREYFSPSALPFSGLVVALSAQCGCPDQIMSQHIPQHGDPNLDQATYPELLQAPVARLGIDALGGAGPFLVDRLGFGGGHTLPPLCHGRGIVGTRRVRIPCRIL